MPAENQAAHPYRDAPPQATISHIRVILDDLGLSMHDAVVRETLGALFGEERAGEAVAEFLRHEQVFRRFSLPQCGSCEGCEAVSDCQYPAWLALADRVRDKLFSRPIDQSALRSVLQIHP